MNEDNDIIQSSLGLMVCDFLDIEVKFQSILSKMIFWAHNANCKMVFQGIC